MPDSLSKRLADSGVLTPSDSANFPLTPDQAEKINQSFALLGENAAKAASFANAYSLNVAPLLTQAAKDSKVSTAEALLLYSAFMKCLADVE